MCPPLGAAKTNCESPIRGRSFSKTASTWDDRGTLYSRLFLVFAAGIVQIRSSSMANHRIAFTSHGLWPVVGFRRSTRAISVSGSALPKGICGLNRPLSKLMMGLFSGCPGTTACPWQLPPAIIVSRLAIENPLVLALAEWHSPQRLVRRGRMSSSRLVAAAKVPGEEE